MKKRTPHDAIKSILKLIPQTERDFRDELTKCAKTALYAAPEIHRAVFARATVAVAMFLGEPPLDGWKEDVRATWMSER